MLVSYDACYASEIEDSREAAINRTGLSPVVWTGDQGFLTRWPSSALGLRISQLRKNIRIARFRRAPADETLTAQFGQGAHQRWLRDDPSAILPDDLVARTVAAEDEDC